MRSSWSLAWEFIPPNFRNGFAVVRGCHRSSYRQIVAAVVVHHVGGVEVEIIEGEVLPHGAAGVAKLASRYVAKVALVLVVLRHVVAAHHVLLRVLHDVVVRAVAVHVVHVVGVAVDVVVHRSAAL